MTIEEQTGESNSPNEAGIETSQTLEEAARAEHDYLRKRLSDELNREPTEDELSDWLRQHTEGY